MLLSMLKNNIFKTYFPLNQIGIPLLILLDLLPVTFPQSFIGSLNIVRKMCNIILIFCAMRDQSLLKPYMIKTTLLRLFIIVFSWIILFLKKCRAPTLPPQEGYQPPLFLIHIMIISLLGSNSCFIRMKTCLIHGLLILIRILILIYPSGSSAGGLSLDLLLKYSQTHWRVLSNILQGYSELMLMGLNSLLCTILGWHC